MNKVKANKLFKEVCKKLNLKGYKLTISGKFKRNLANAQVWDSIYTGKKEIRVSKRYLATVKPSRLIKTFIHEIAHFIQFEEIFKKVRFRKSKPWLDSDRMVSYYKKLPRLKHNLKGVWDTFWHNDKFFAIMEELEEKLKNE